MAEHELRELVRRAQESDPDAWEQLYVRGYSRLLSYACRRLSSRDEADDAVSEAFARAYRQIERFRWRGAGFDAWMYGILRNVVNETHRRTSRVRPGVVPDLVSLETSPLDHVLDNEEAARVRRAFARLSPDDREVLELRIVCELDANQAAAALGKRAGAVRMAQSRALARLRVLMKEVTRVND